MTIGWSGPFYRSAAIGLAGENVQIINNDFSRSPGSTERLSMILGYFLRGTHLIHGNVVQDDIETEDTRLRFVYLTASGSSTYFDLWNSRGGILSIVGNDITTSVPNRYVQFFIQDTFNAFENLNDIADPDLYSENTTLSMEVYANTGMMIR